MKRDAPKCCRYWDAGSRSSVYRCPVTMLRQSTMKTSTKMKFPRLCASSRRSFATGMSSSAVTVTTLFSTAAENSHIEERAKLNRNLVSSRSFVCLFCCFCYTELICTRKMQMMFINMGRHYIQFRMPTAKLMFKDGNNFPLILSNQFTYFETINPQKKIC